MIKIADTSLRPKKKNKIHEKRKEKKTKQSKKIKKK